MNLGISPVAFAVNSLQSLQISAKLAGFAGRIFQLQLDLANEQTLLKIWTGQTSQIPPECIEFVVFLPQTPHAKCTHHVKYEKGYLKYLIFQISFRLFSGTRVFLIYSVVYVLFRIGGLF